MTPRVRTLALTSLAAAIVLIATPAFAHVGMEVANPRPGATTSYTVSVPNESESATTDLIELQLPEGLEVTGFKPGRGGWTMTVEDGVLVIQGGQIEPGERRDFSFTAISPRQAGELVFPAIQTYSDGEEVRWVGEEGSDKPAAVVVLSGRPVAAPPPSPEPTNEAPSPAVTSAAPSPVPTAPASDVPPSAEASDPADDDPAADSGAATLPIVLIVLAALGVALTLVARNRRS